MSVTEEGLKVRPYPMTRERPRPTFSAALPGSLPASTWVDYLLQHVFTASRENTFERHVRRFVRTLVLVALLEELRSHGYRLWVEGHEFKWQGPAPLEPEVVSELERHGPETWLRLTLDETLDRAFGVGKVKRGGAVEAKPNEELRRKVRLFKKVQGAREDALEALGGDPERSKRDAPVRLALGGLQEFTAGRENTHKRPKGYAPWRPQKKTVKLIMQAKEVLEEYRAYLPLTARQIFYRLVGAYGYPKTESKYDALSDYLVRARRAKMISFDHIRDDGISVADHAHYADENDFYKHINDMGKAYKRDKLVKQKVDIRVYCEAAGMIPQISRVCEPYSIPVYSCSGFDSLSGKYELKEACWQAFTYRGHQTVILHLGDYDPSGESIFNDGLVEDIHAFLAKDVPHKEPHEVAIFERVALRPEHIGRFNLPTEPPKATDSRTKNWQGEAACQLEALPPDVLASLLDAAIKAHLNLAVYERDLKDEEVERRRIAKALPSGAA